MPTLPFFLQQMERFKVVERETKTKAYSKEGVLGLRFSLRERESVCVLVCLSVLTELPLC